MRVDLDGLADRLDEASEALDMATRNLMPPHSAAVRGETAHALSQLWHLSGRMAGMADALRMATRTAQEGRGDV